jgi:hypothetical protein
MIWDEAVLDAFEQAKVVVCGSLSYNATDGPMSREGARGPFPGPGDLTYPVVQHEAWAWRELFLSTCFESRASYLVYRLRHEQDPGPDRLDRHALNEADIAIMRLVPAPRPGAAPTGRVFEPLPRLAIDVTDALGLQPPHDVAEAVWETRRLAPPRDDGLDGLVFDAAVRPVGPRWRRAVRAWFRGCGCAFVVVAARTSSRHWHVPDEVRRLCDAEAVLRIAEGGLGLERRPGRRRPLSVLARVPDAVLHIHDGRPRAPASRIPSSPVSRLPNPSPPAPRLSRRVPAVDVGGRGREVAPLPPSPEERPGREAERGISLCIRFAIRAVLVVVWWDTLTLCRAVVTSARNGVELFSTARSFRDILRQEQTRRGILRFKIVRSRGVCVQLWH